MTERSQADIFVGLINALDFDEDPWNVYYDDLFDKHIETRVTSENRWTKFVECVFECNDGSYFAFETEHGLTEYQDASPNSEAYLVKPHDKIVTVYKRVGEN